MCGTDLGGFRGEGAHRSRGFHSGANRPVGCDGGGAEEQPRAPARWSRELTVSVRRFGEGPERRSAVAQRWPTRWHSCGGGGRKGLLHRGGGVVLLL
jgi:hypothetical protein